MLFRKLQLIFIAGLLGLVLAACGDSDSTSDKQSTAPDAMSQEAMSKESMAKNMSEGDSGSTLKAYDPDVPSMVVEDNGVVQQQEIYQNWPKQTAAASSDSAATSEAQDAPSAATEAKLHTVYGQATSFSPNILFINPGDTVQWENMTIHDSVSMEGLIPDGAKPWKFNIGQNGAVTLTEEGVYIYKCIPHYPNGMVAAIVVGKPVNIEQIQANATGRAKGIVIKVVKALATR